MHQGFATQAAKGQGERLRAEQNEEDHRADAQGAVQGLLERVTVQASGAASDKQCTQRTDGRGFGGCSQATDDRAEHTDHQQQRRQDRFGDVLPQLFTADQRALFGWNRRHPLRAQPAEQQHVGDVDAGEHQAGDKGRGKDRTHRLTENIGQQNQHQARRNDLPQGARCADGAAGHAGFVAAAQQHWQGQQANGHHGGADDAGGGAEQHADQHDGQAHAAVQAAHGLADRLQHVLGDFGFLQHHPHKRKQRYRQQRVVADHAEHARRQQAEQHWAEADQAGGETGHSQGNGHRHADHHH